MEKIVLASQSPRRKQLLEWADIPFEVIASNSDESYPASMAYEQVPVHIALNKALAVQNFLSDKQRVILAADTIVVLNNTIIGKPANREEAISIITSLSGNTHIVITGVSIIKGGKQLSFSDATEVTFHPLSPEQVVYYVDHYKPYDKAGAYAIQEWIGVTGIKSIKGDFYNVMGLPISRVIQYLSAFDHS